ncbi:MAG: pirin family protein [Spirochaetes bacterium]|nr:pirin family protein [Spirochaetota bacterium]
MKKIQSLTEYHARTVREGAGVKLSRIFGFNGDAPLDPFLLLDHFHSDDPADYTAGFPWHPHRGIETVTYLLKGSVRHGDSLGNKGVIGAGDIQWMTAGSGIIHEEMPEAGDGINGFQLWVNLPAKQKMMDPRYRGITAEEIPVVTDDNGVTVRVIAGTYGKIAGPVKELVMPVSYLDVTLAADTSYPLDVTDGGFCYLFDGDAQILDETIPTLTAVQLSQTCTITAGKSGARFLFICGKPIGEPVAWYGPIVMNTQEELRIAFEEYQNGTFIKKK